MKRISYLLVVLVVSSGLHPRSSSAIEVAESEALRRVIVAEARTSAGAGAARFSGVTRASRRARLAFTLGGRLAERPAQLGDRVAEGQILARLDDGEMVNAVDAARASLAELLARSEQQARDEQRVERLVVVKAATTEELEAVAAGADALEAAVEKARVGLAEAQRLRGETLLRAPFDATVVEVAFEAGEHVAPGHSVVAIQGLARLEVEIEVPEALLMGIGVGTEVTVELPARAQSMEGRIGFLSRAASGRGRLFPVVVELEAGEGVLAGSTAEVILRRPGLATVSIPVEAVIDPGGHRPTVFKVENGKVVKVLVELGSLVGSAIEVDGEIAAGDLVVVAGQRGLLDGDRVETIR